MDFGSTSLLLGLNGSGKSSIFQVLRKLNGFVALQMPTRDLFFAFEATRWSHSKDQKFGVDFEYQNHHYQYQLVIQFDRNEIPSVHSEILRVNGEQIVKFANEKVELAGESPYPLEPNRSAISSIPDSYGLDHLKTFRQLLHRILVVQVVPPAMEGTSSEETVYLWPDARNWVSWYRFSSQDQSYIIELKDYLASIFPGFSHFQFVDIGLDSTGKNSKGLLLNFVTPQDASKTGYTFAELSDGQRALIALYAILVHARREGYVLCLDEPENFLTLAEIQPWLVELYDSCSEGKLQAILISHHPEVINYLAEDAGVWFERSVDGSVSAKRMHKEVETGLPMSEIVARGWVDA